MFRSLTGIASLVALVLAVGVGNATAQDGLRIHLVDAAGARLTTLLKVSGDRTRRTPKWKALNVRLPGGLGGRDVAIELVAVDAGGGSTVEAGVDQVRVTTD